MQITAKNRSILLGITFNEGSIIKSFFDGIRELLGLKKRFNRGG